MDSRMSVKDRLGLQEKMDLEHEKILVSGNSVTKTMYNCVPMTKKEVSAEKQMVPEQYIIITIIFSRLNLIKSILAYYFSIFRL